MLDEANNTVRFPSLQAMPDQHTYATHLAQMEHEGGRTTVYRAKTDVVRRREREEQDDGEQDGAMYFSCLAGNGRSFSPSRGIGAAVSIDYGQSLCVSQCAEGKVSSPEPVLASNR